jgi:hypothetical protein
VVVPGKARYLIIFGGVEKGQLAKMHARLRNIKHVPSAQALSFPPETSQKYEVLEMKIISKFQKEFLGFLSF